MHSASYKHGLGLVFLCGYCIDAGDGNLVPRPPTQDLSRSRGSRKVVSPRLRDKAWAGGLGTYTRLGDGL